MTPRKGELSPYSDLCCHHVDKQLLFTGPIYAKHSINQPWQKNNVLPSRGCRRVLLVTSNYNTDYYGLHNHSGKNVIHSIGRDEHTCTYIH